MSTKIWEAYRLKPDFDIWEVMFEIRRRAEKNIRKTLAKLYAALIEDVKRDPEMREWLHPMRLRAGALMDVDPAKFGYLQASRFVLDQFRQTTGHMERSIWDLNVAVVVRRPSRGKYLLIPYPGSGLFNGSLAFLRRHKALADFHYQNATDRPRHISVQAWEGRARTWEPLLEDDRWQDKLELSIVSVDGWFRIDPAWDLIRRDMRREMRAGKTAEQAVEAVTTLNVENAT